MITFEPDFSAFEFKVFGTCPVVDTGDRSTYESIFILILSPVAIYSQTSCCDICKIGSQLHLGSFHGVGRPSHRDDDDDAPPPRATTTTATMTTTTTTKTTTTVQR